MTTTDTNSIDVPRAAIEAVLLADGWHHTRDQSFRTAPLSIDGTTEVDGFRFVEGLGGHLMAGPLSSVLAVRYKDA